MILWIIKELPNKAYLWLGYHFLDIGFKDFSFAIYQTQDLHGVNLSMKIWLIQIMIIHIVVMSFHIWMYLCINILVKITNTKNEYISFYR
jgi:hypothetical protein